MMSTQRIELDPDRLYGYRSLPRAERFTLTAHGDHAEGGIDGSRSKLGARVGEKIGDPPLPTT